MKQVHNIQRGKSLIAVLSAALALLMIASSLGMIGEVYAKAPTAPGTATVSAATNPNKGKSYTVVYSTGKMSAFAAKTYSDIKTDESGCIILPGATFADVATLSDSYDCETILGSDGWYYSFTGWQVTGQTKKLPDETVFQPGDVITPEILAKYASNGILDLSALWGKVYFIQNKYGTMTYKKLARSVVSDGSWTTLNYLALDTKNSQNPTGAYDYKDGVANTGKSYSAPIATVDHLYARFDADGVDPLDAYATVAMLTGTLDYVKSRGTQYVTTPSSAQLNNKPSGYVAAGSKTNEYVDAEGYAYRPESTRRFGETYNARAVTFKSSQRAAAGTVYSFFYKAYDDESNFRGSTRFDNVDLCCKSDSNSGNSYYFLGDQCGVIARPYEGDPVDNNTADAEMQRKFVEEHYFETTARLRTSTRSPIAQVRACQAERVVLNGGTYDSFSHSWSDNQSADSLHVYHVGRNANIGSLYGGSTDSMGKKNYTFPLEIVITGGTVNYVYATSVSGIEGSRCSGGRMVRVYGGANHQPDVYVVYAGGYGAPLTGNVELVIKGCTDIDYVRGGGYQYTADVTGNINVLIEDSTILQNVYGGGLYGDCLDDGSKSKGKVTVNIVRSTVNREVYGSGQGNVNYTDFNTTDDQGITKMPAWWDTPETGFSSVNTSTGVVTQYVIHQLGRRSGAGMGGGSVMWMKVTRQVYLSVAQVESSNITVTDSTVGTVYGGGYLGHVVGNTNISISNSKVTTVYGGSDGTASLSNVTLYQPCDDTVTVNGETVVDYLGPRPNGPDANGNYEWDKTNYATRRDGKTKYEFESLGSYSWASGSPAIDHSAKKIYSTEMTKAGVVKGSTHVTVSGSSSVGTVYGGGKGSKATVASTTLDIASGTVTGAVYGGGDSGTVLGSTDVEITGGTFNSGVHVFGGGKSASVASTKLQIKGGTFGDNTGAIYGGGNAGAVNGGVDVDITGGAFAGVYVYGGGSTASVASVDLSITGGNFSSTGGDIYGGGRNGAVNGAVAVKIEKLSNPVYYEVLGGGYNGAVNSVTLNLTEVTIMSNIYGGGNQSSAVVKGNVVINATDITHGTPGDDNTYNPTIYGGGYKANVNGSITMNLNNGFFEWIHGGGYSGVCKDVTINLRGGKAAKDPYDSSRSTTQPVVAWCLRGGGDKGECEDVVINMWAGDVSRNTHTAGNDCTVKSSTFNMYGGYTENIFGGGDHGNVLTNSQVNLYGGRVATIYGGGDRPTSRVGGAGVLIDDNADNTATLTISGNVYGGSDQGIIMAKETTTAKLIENGSVFNYGTGPSAQFNGRGGTKVEIKSGTVKNTVFAGCNGTAYSDSQEPDGNSNFGSIRGTGEDGYSTQLLISGGTINASVYGGNNAAGQLAGDTLVKITGGTVTGNVYGGNLGGSGTYDQGGANIVGTATVQISGGTVSGEVYGGSDASGNIVEGTLVEITGGTVSNNVFGANKGNKNKNPTGATIEGTATVRIAGGTVCGSGKYVYGGNNALGSAGATSVEITGMGLDNLKSSTIYGGNNAGGKVTGQSAVTITNSTVQHVVGGNFSGGSVGSTLVTLNNSSADNTYGGNEKEGAVTGQAQVVVTNSSTLKKGVYGGNFEGGTVGSTLVTFTNKSTSTNITDGGIYGGNNNGGIIVGNAEVTLDSDMYLLVFGGNKKSGEIGGSTFIDIKQGVKNDKITTNPDTYYSLNVYGGNNAGGTVKGDSNILIEQSGGHVSSVFGGNLSNGIVAGSANITLKCGSVWFLLVGGNRNGGTVGTAAKPATSGVSITMTNDAAAKQIANLYGGNYEGGTIYGDVDITLDGGPATNSGLVEYEVYGGNVTTGTINGDVTINVKPNADIILEKYESVDSKTYSLFGGNKKGGHITGMVTINIEGSTGKIPYVFGGSNNGGTIGTLGNANTGVTINMTGGEIAKNLFGGSNQSGAIYGSLNVTIGGDAVVNEWVFGGGNQADVALVSNLTIQDNASITYACGGANEGDVLGTNVIMTGGVVPTLFGGSNAGAGSVSGNTSVKISGGTVTSVRGGGNWADTYGSTYVEATGGIINERINGAGNKSIVTGNAEVVVKGGTVENIFGGGDSGQNKNGEGEHAYLYGDAFVTIQSGANITGSVFGAGNNKWAHSYGDATIQISGGTIAGSVYGGGNNGLMEIDTTKNSDGGDTFITITGGTIGNSIYGGGNNADVPGNATITCTNLALAQNFFGGGNAGDVGGDVSITINSGSVGNMFFGGGNAGDVAGSVDVTVRNGEFKDTFFGGGATADVGGDVDITIENGKFHDNVYGGGEQGNVEGDVTMNISGGEFTYKQNLEVYGGGKNGTVNSTSLSITGITNISGDVFGGGEGQNASVFEGTEVYVDLPYSFQVEESVHFTDDITTSGRVESKLIDIPNLESGSIGGSVYGGGNLGRVGLGTISAGGDKATIQTVAQTKVKIVNGKIGGSVFGGGRGIPGTGVTYNIRMGTVFGSTDVDILGGLIMGNVYGGGEQSRVYASGKTAATVDIIETATNSTNTEFKKIGIYGSVFGGGDRGEGDDANASVPTVYGDVYVTIQGHKDNQPSEIYFITGGVYGDGNLCLVDGYRKIVVKDFEPSPDKSKEMLKTFFSLQRADLAVMDNSAVVLLGARDLVEEGDTSVYSINRIGMLELKNGSTVKLDQIVKYLGGLDSDVHNERYFIRNGQNGFSGTYDSFITGEKCNCGLIDPDKHTCNLLEPLTNTQIQNYHDNKDPHSADTKNVVCVANGLYLEVINEEDEYGPVDGLFTLQLTYANPGEGGGFVYASIPESTGDFICETHRWSFSVNNNVTASNYQSLVDENLIFVREPGKGFRRPTGAYDSNKIYYSRVVVVDSENKPVFMDIIDDVGGAVSSGNAVNGYTYYYWYIGGPSVTFDVNLTGYIGAAATSFSANTTLPQHAVPYSYVLYGVDVNEALEKAVASDYDLVQKASVSGQQIALELRATVYDEESDSYVAKSLGFLYYDSTAQKWGLKQGTTGMTGYNGDADIVDDNILMSTRIGSTNDQLAWVLHKSPDVTKTCSDLEVYVDIDLFESDTNGNPHAVTTGTSALSYTAALNIVRLTATQSAFVQNGGNYNGVANNESVHITGSSKFTVEWQTRYVPAANPKENGMTMTWALSTQQYTYYMNESTGEYFSCRVGLNDVEDAFNFADGMNVGNFASEFVKLSNGNYKRGDAIFSLKSSFASEAIPARTRITMVDMNGSNPAYYYYICTGDETYIDLMNFKQMGTNTMIRDLADSQKPAFIWAYDAQTMAMITERLVFVFDLDVQAGNEFTGSLTLQHMYGNAQNAVDILDYAKAEMVGNSVSYRRYFPKDVTYEFNPGSTGVNTSTYKAEFKEVAYSDIGTAVLNVHVKEDENWINTLFRENGFAVKVSLVDSNGKSLAMPAGMYFEYRGEYYYPGPDSTYVSVPVMEFGDHEIIIHNPQFSLKTAVGGDTATFKVEYYSAPDANYYDSFNTDVSGEASYQIIESPSYSLRVVSGDAAQIYEPKDIVALRYTTDKSVNAATERVKVTVNLKNRGTGEYDQVDWQALFSTSAPGAMAEGNGVNLQWKIADNAASGTYRLIFTYADHTEYVNIIVK